MKHLRQGSSAGLTPIKVHVRRVGYSPIAQLADLRRRPNSPRQRIVSGPCWASNLIYLDEGFGEGHQPPFSREIARPVPAPLGRLEDTEPTFGDEAFTLFY